MQPGIWNVSVGAKNTEACKVRVLLQIFWLSKKKYYSLYQGFIKELLHINLRGIFVTAQIGTAATHIGTTIAPCHVKSV